MSIEGKRLGNYRIVRELGGGGYGQVFLGVHTFLEVPVAVKVLRSVAPSPEARTLFLEEARVIARLDHPSIIRIRDFAIIDEVPFLVMDFASGGTCRHRCSQGSRLPLSALLPIVRQIAQALDYAATMGIVHRDVKPENILFNGNGDALLGDFGIAALKSTAISPEQARGTAVYIAPEQTWGQVLPASDQYSLAVCVYEWLTGHPPFVADDKTALIVCHRFAVPPPLCPQVQDLAPAIEKVVVRALAKKPEERFPTVEAFVDALTNAAIAAPEVEIREKKGEISAPVHPALVAIVTTSWNVPFARNPFFTGRHVVLSHLHHLLCEGDEPFIALAGLAGSGKTQTVIEYAYRFREAWHVLAFVHAETREAFLADMLVLAREVRVPETIENVVDWLKHSSNWLLILDNLEDPTLIQVFAGLRGRFLVTTRSQLIGGMKMVPLDDFSPEEAVPFLLRRAGLLALDAALPPEDSSFWEHANAVVQVLDGLPLALDQAGAYIDEMECSLTDYLHQYHTRGRRLLLGRRGQRAQQNHPESVATTWALSFEKVALLNPMAADLLCFCAFLAPDAIPLDVVLAACQGDALVLGGALATLGTFSLMQREREQSAVSMHRLVQLVIREALPSEERRQWVQRVIQAVLQIFPHEEEKTFWLQAQRLLPQVEAILAVIEEECLALLEAGHLFNIAGLYALRQAQYTQAEHLLLSALGQRTVVLGPDHPDVTESLNDLGLLYYTCGDLDQAERFFRQTLAMQRRVAGASEHLAIALNNVASVCRKRKNSAEAEWLFREALAIWQNHGQGAHAARALNNLALLYQEQGQQEDAASCLRQALTLWQKLSSPDPDMGRTLCHLAKVCREQKQYREAETLLLQAQEIQARSLLPDHPDIAETLHELAGLYHLAERYEEAEFYALFALEIFEQALGAEHPKVRAVFADYRALLLQLGHALPQRLISWEV